MRSTAGHIHGFCLVVCNASLTPAVPAKPVNGQQAATIRFGNRGSVEADVIQVDFQIIARG